MDARLKAKPDLQLLLPLEPAHKVFLRNLTDTLLGRSVPPLATTTRPAPFWNDVFVPSAPPWGAFMESMLWHLAVVSVLWTVAQTWVKQEQIQQQRFSERSSLTYYPPPKSFPTSGSRAPRVREHPKTQLDSSKSPLRVAPEPNQPENKPPDIGLAKSVPPSVIAAKASSQMPLFAPRLPQATIPEAPTSAVAPAANIGQATTRQLALPQASPIAPAPDVGSLSARRTVTAPNGIAVAPAPNLQAAIRQPSGASIGNPQIVRPSPLMTRDQAGISHRVPASLPRPAVVIPTASANGSGILGGGRLSSRVDLPVVPPTPSIKGAGSFSKNKPLLSLSNGSVISPAPSIRSTGGLTGRGRSSSLPSGGTQAVPPAPSGVSGNSIGGVRVASLSGASPHVIPPPASLGEPNSGRGKRGNLLSGLQAIPPSPKFGSGNSMGGSRVASLSAAGPRVIPPPASLSGRTSSGGGRGNTLSDAQAVPPPPSINGSGRTAGNGRTASLSGGDQPVLPPAAPAGDAGNSTAAAPMATDANAVPPAPGMDKSSVPATIELPVRVIGLALSLRTSSYFSNYEVFIAERRVKKGDPELIKLVYESLPYQPRLAEYGLDNSKVYKLRVVRDATCDESLLQMTWPQKEDSHPGSKDADPPSDPADKNTLLPCYRTTADDYRIAVTRGR
jgi:hypothetical protein